MSAPNIQDMKSVLKSHARRFKTLQGTHDVVDFHVTLRIVVLINRDDARMHQRLTMQNFKVATVMLHQDAPIPDCIVHVFAIWKTGSTGFKRYQHVMAGSA